MKFALNAVLFFILGVLLLRCANAADASILCGYPPPAAPGCVYVCECTPEGCRFVELCP